ncbi:MAG: carboxypeptidase regulatory-like domain-containing protein, partial [Myxococcales bacterium]|nr:carboxypeptidase regulatory-like domain-containing protein [Myxococcales bacterium]
GEPEPWRATSLADGAFLLDTIPTGPIVIEAEKRGYAPTIVDALAPEEGVVVVLEGLRDLAGDVLGTPEQLARATVRIEGSSIWPPLEVPVAADGSFVIPEIADGVYGLVAAAPAPEGATDAPEYASIPLENVSPDMQVSLALIEAVRVPVAVRGPDGEAIPSARVTVSGSSIGILQQLGETDAEGLARVGPVVPGPYFVHADADGYLPSETVVVDAQIDVPMPTIELRLVRPARIAGRVLDEHGQPVPEARVSVESDVLFSPGESMVRARTLNALLAGGSLGVTHGIVPPIPLFDEDTAGPWIEGGMLTDRDGKFALGALVPGTYRLHAVHERHAGSAVQVVRLRAGEVDDDVVLILQRGQPLTGRLRDTNDQPIVGARVELDDGLIVLTDEYGVFDAGLHKGRRRLVLRAPGMIPQAIELEVGDRAVDLERTLEAATGVLEGRLRDQNDRPIAGARVALFPDDGISATEVTYTDDKGLFDFDGLTPGGAELEVDHRDFAPYERRLRVPASDGRFVEIGLSVGWWLAVHVRALGSGDPIAGAKVRAGDQLVITDAAGDALIRRLASERVDVAVEAAGWVRERTSVERPEDGDADLVVDLEEGAAIEGSIQDERGEPVAKARITIRDRRSGELIAEVESDAEGTWRVDRLSEGDVIVEAAPPGELSEILAPVSENSDVLRGRVTRGVDLRFDRL